MMHYQEINVYNEKDKTTVEFQDNTIKFYGISMEDAAKFIKVLLEEAF